jgi:hypothetical protein
MSCATVNKDPQRYSKPTSWGVWTAVTVLKVKHAINFHRVMKPCVNVSSRSAA